MAGSPGGQMQRRRASRWLPFLPWMSALTTADIRRDTMAGLTGAVLVVPQGVAYALLAGLPPQYGLYTAIVPAALAALFGSSRQMVSGPTAALSIALFATLQPMAGTGGTDYLSMVLTLTFVAGLFQLLLGLARLGVLVDLVSHSVVTGFTAGAAVIIAVNQVPYLLGLPSMASDGFLGLLPLLLESLRNAQGLPALIAAATIGGCLAIRRWLPRWPAMLLALVGASALAAWLDPQGAVINRITAMPGGLPPLSAPDLTLDSLRQVTPGAIALGLLGLVEAAAITRAFAARNGERIDANQEFIGQGLSNLAGPFFSGYLSSGSFTRSGLNAMAGAGSPLAAVLSAVILVPVLLVAAPLLSHVPMAAMGGLLLVVAFNLIDRDSIIEAMRCSRAETAVLLITFASTLLLALEFAVYFGVLASLALYLRRTTRPPVLIKTLDQAPARLQQTLVEPETDVVRIDGSLFFGACETVDQQLEPLVAPNLVILAAGINFLDLSGIHLLRKQAHRCQARGGQLYLAWPKPDVETRLRRAGILIDQSDNKDVITFIRTTKAMFL